MGLTKTQPGSPACAVGGEHSGQGCADEAAPAARCPMMRGTEKCPHWAAAPWGPGPGHRCQGVAFQNPRPHPTTPAAGGPGRWSCSRTRPCPRRSRGCTGTLWCSVHGTSRSWKGNVGPESGRMLSPSGLAHRLEGKLDPTTTASAPILSLSSCPSAALTHSPGLRKLPPPPAPGPCGLACSLTGAPGPAGCLSSSSRSCVPRWPAEGGPTTVSEVGAAASTAHPLQQLQEKCPGEMFQNTDRQGQHDPGQPVGKGLSGVPQALKDQEGWCGCGPVAGP